MDIFIGLVRNILEEGFIFGIMAMGVFITYSVLDFPDLSVDGTFPLGACTTAALISIGVNPYLSCLMAFIAGSAAGMVTGFLHVKLKITNLLSGILTMTAMWSVNLFITKGSSILAYYNKPTIFTSGLAAIFPRDIYVYRIAVVGLIAVVVSKIVLDLYLKTKSGLLLRSAGDNQQFVISISRDPGKMKMVGLAIGNGFTALSGSIYSQQYESADINSGTGMVVMALASVIIGKSVFGKIRIMKPTTMAVVGAILYRACLVAALQMGLNPDYLKLLMAVLFTLALVSTNFFSKRRNKPYVNTPEL
ncbi:MAG TPA: ABC transporter permease [Ruminococcaceae bacterium]|nr:ABC transporter permease [Oscillospiraceae bacterium]